MKQFINKERKIFPVNFIHSIFISRDDTEMFHILICWFPASDNTNNAWNVNRNGNLNNNNVNNDNNYGVRPYFFKTKFYRTKVGK